MRLLSLPLPTVLSGLVAVLVGYASSAAIIWQAALAAGATPAEIAGWMTALGIAMGISTLTLTLAGFNRLVNAWRRSVGNRASGIIVARRGGHIHCRQCPDCAVRRHGIVCAFDADNPPFSCRRNAGGNTATLRPAGVRDAQRRVCHVRRYAIGVATL